MAETYCNKCGWWHESKKEKVAKVAIPYSDQFSGAATTDDVVVFDRLQRSVFKDADGYWTARVELNMDGNRFVGKAQSRRRYAALAYAFEHLSKGLFTTSEVIRAKEAQKNKEKST